jgi:hypothetical protein
MMERITIVIETGNAAFEDSPTIEIARILRAMADRIESCGLPPVPRDANGNKCGSVTVEEVK